MSRVANRIRPRSRYPATKTFCIYAQLREVAARAIVQNTCSRSVPNVDQPGVRITDATSLTEIAPVTSCKIADSSTDAVATSILYLVQFNLTTTVQLAVEGGAPQARGVKGGFEPP